MSSTITEQKENYKEENLYNDLLPDTISLEYLFYEDALITATKLVPFLYERCNGIKTISTSKKSKQIVSKHSVNPV